MTRPTLPDPRPAAVAMVGVLVTWYAAWRIERAAGLQVDVVVLATVLALSLGRVVRRGGAPGSARGAVRIVAIPVVALAATEVGRLLARHEWTGGAVFVLVLAAAIWIRRFGPHWTALGTLVTLPFIALLVVPVPVGPATARTLWPAVMALLALAVVLVAHRLGCQLGWVTPPSAAPEPPRRVRSARIPASTRMAIQLLVALAASYALGRWLFPDHWPWLVLSAYVVCSGNRGRGDVLHKGVLRLVGALVGTASATLLAGAFPAGDRTAIVLVFVVMALALWLRDASYAFWAGGVTAMLALLHAFYGVGGLGELGQRLIGVAVGSAIAVVVSWYLLPVRSSDAFRRRWADALAALSDLLTALREDPDTSAEALRRFQYAVAQLDQLAPAFRFHLRTLRRGRLRRAHPAVQLATMRSVAEAVAALEPADAVAYRPEVVAWSRRVGAIRRRMRGGVPVAGPGQLVDLAGDPDDCDAEPSPAYRRVSAVSSTLELLDEGFTREAWLRLGGA